MRLKELREKRNMNMRQTALALGIPYTTYISYEKGDREPNSEMLINLADFFNCSVDYLIGRSDEPIDDSVLDKVLELDQDILEQKGNIYDAKKAQLERDKGKTINELFTETVCEKEIIHITKYRTLDKYGKQAVDSVLDIEYERCTAVENYDEPTIITFNRFNINKASAGCGYDLSNSDDWQEIKVIDTPEARKADFAVEVDGHSMEPTINDGDIVYVVVDADVPEGEIGLFRQNGEGFIKEKGKDRLISHNPDYPDISPEDGEIDCIGRVIGVAELP